VAFKRPVRTHYLDTGDYAVLSCVCKEDVLSLERIERLNFPEQGDFITVLGTTGPINANVFIKLYNEKFPKYLLIEGDKIGEPNCPVPVYDLVNKYLEKRCSRN
jgi:hypothetical protein